MKKCRLGMFFKASILLFILIVPVCRLSAQTYYALPAVNVPLHLEKSEIRLFAGFTYGSEVGGSGLQVSTSITSNIALMGNSFMLSRNHFDSPKRTKGNMHSIGIGLFAPNKHFIFEIYPGISWGEMSFSSSADYRLEVQYYKPFIQPSIGFRTKHFETAFSTGICIIKYHHIESNFTNEYVSEEIQYLREHRKRTVFEPAFTIRYGSRRFKAQLQVAGSENIIYHRFRQEGVMVSLGICVQFDLIANI
ncbi:MAG: hypothetical protein K8R90_06755 [Candidatus Cloacimonetes bacterium]|nr:hypothetical protein [Candidatus Cloacimonadota bacterium]